MAENTEDDGQQYFNLDKTTGLITSKNTPIQSDQYLLFALATTDSGLMANTSVRSYSVP